jgi:hypothetical protein
MIPITPVIIFVPTPAPVPTMGNGWGRHVRHNFLPPNQKPRRLPSPPIEQTPTFDRKALHRRVERLLKETRPMRDEQLKAAIALRLAS